jgi:hypothetical protein
MGNLGAAQKDRSHMCPLQNVHRRTDMESYWAQITRYMLPEQERSRLENYG